MVAMGLLKEGKFGGRSLAEEAEHLAMALLGNR